MKRLRIKDDARKIVQPKRLLTPDLIEKFCELVKRGLPADGCCDYLCIHTSTFWRWLKRGELYNTGDEQPTTDEIIGRFVMLYRRASAEYRLELVKRLHRTSSPMWVRDMAVLERRDRKSFSRNDQAGGTDDEFDPDEKFL